MDRARIAPQRCRRRVIYQGEPALLDQTADYGAGDRLCHRPARRRTIGGAEFAVPFAQDALGRGDQDAVGARRAGEEAIERAGNFVRRVGRRLDDIAERPGVSGLRSPTGDRLRIETQARLRAQDDAAIAGPGNRGADNRLAETGVVPADVTRRSASSISTTMSPRRWAATSSAWPSGAARNPSPPGGTAGRQRKCRSAVARSSPLT